MAASAADPKTRVLSLGAVFLQQTGPATRLLRAAAIGIAAALAAALARVGSAPARLSAGVLLIAVLFGVGAFAVSRARRRKEPEFVLAKILARVDRERAERTGRAFGLWKRLSGQEKPAESLELASLHLTRLLDQTPVYAVREAARTLARRRLRIAVALFGVLSFVVFLVPLMMLEGFDVLLARRGVGPIFINYVETFEVTAQFPAYLDGSGQKHSVPGSSASVPVGSEIEVRVLPLVEDRAFLLTDGVSEVPFLSDGKGGLIARFRADNPAELRVAARFGDVLLFDDQSARLTPIDDRAPTVVLAGAPAEHSLEDLDRLPLTFYVHDDHGLSQVDLVVESGQRSERQELARLDGSQRVYRGGHTLTRQHELLKKAFLPVHVRIEARDGNVATGPSWGSSKEFVLQPKALGKDVAERHVALRAFRRELTGFLAATLSAAGQTHEEAEKQRVQAFAKLRAAGSLLSEALSKAENIPRYSLSFIEAQVEALSRLGAERAEPEAVLLAVDSLIQRFGMKEAPELAKDLGAAVEELAVQARELRFRSESVRPQGVFDLLSALKNGASQLTEVGNLGQDLGSVARADLARIERSLVEKSYARAEGAAIHLAERLKRANSSFSAKGGGGVESGNGSGEAGGQAGPPGEGEASNAPSKFEQLAQDLDQLAQDNAAELSQLERLLKQAEEAAARDFQKEPEMDRNLEALRRALEELPSTGFGPDTPRSEAAQARAEGEAMADAMEGGNLKEALERGDNARAALERAAQLAERYPGFVDPTSIGRARDAVKRAIDQARDSLRKFESGASSREREALAEGADARRKLRERANEISERARSRDAPLPQENLDALKRAADLLQKAEDSLRRGDAPGGLEYSEQAQTQLERALPRSEAPPSQEGNGAQGEGAAEGEQATHGEVPEEERDRAREFRERVERGLSLGSGHLAPAVRKYAEELK